MNKLAVCAISMIGGASAPTVNAHHSLAVYSNERIEIAGEITGVSWRNPHVILELEAMGNDGKQTWRMEGGSVTTLQRAGVTRDLVRLGTPVRVAGFPSRREPFILSVTNVLLPDGREVQFLTGAPAYFRGAEGMVRGVEHSVDAQRENRGMFRVWSVPIPNPAGASALRNLPFTPQAVAARASFDPLDNFATRCEPEGMPRIMFNPHPFELIDRGDTIVLRAELYDTERVIHMDRGSVPEDQQRSRLGYSIGRWDGGGALVITTTNVDWPFFDNAGTPQSSAVEIVERYTLSDDQARLSLNVTVTDPATFTVPAAIETHWLALGHTIDRYDCRLGTEDGSP